MNLIRYSSLRSVVDTLSHLYDRKYQKSIEVVDLFRFIAETRKGLVYSKLAGKDMFFSIF